MKKTLFLFFIVSLGSLMSFGSPEKTQMSDPEPQHDHNNLPLPADEPDVYYDNTTQEIIIDGPGAVGYYDVEIASATNWYIYISTHVSGSYGTIDISSLPQGEYVITIDSPSGNSFEGYFETY